MPQTVEALDHARAAEVPIVIAINKIDRPNANIDRVKQQLADRDLLVEDWGGDVIAVPISALKGEGIDDLLEMLTLTAEVAELRASPELQAQGVVIEASMATGRGSVGDGPGSERHPPARRHLRLRFDLGPGPVTHERSGQAGQGGAAVHAGGGGGASTNFPTRATRSRAQPRRRRHARSPSSVARRSVASNSLPPRAACPSKACSRA